MSHAHIDVRYVAKLARLELTENEVTTFQAQLDSIMGHVESLSALEIPDHVEADTEPLYGHMRADIPRASLAPELVLQNAPDQSQSQIRVPKVVADA